MQDRMLPEKMQSGIFRQYCHLERSGKDGGAGSNLETDTGKVSSYLRDLSTPERGSKKMAQKKATWKADLTITETISKNYTIFSIACFLFIYLFDPTP